MRRALASLAGDRAGTMTIETALVAPVLVLMSLGAFEVSMMVARQSELQSAAADAAAIVMAAHPTTQEQIAAIRNVVRASAGLADNQVTITRVYRCGTAPNYVEASAACSPDDEVSTVLRITMTDTYAPAWTGFGVGEALDYRVVRTVQLG